MDFKIRPSGLLLIRVVTAAMFFLLAALNFFSPINKAGLLHYNYVLYFVAAVMFALSIYRELYFTLSGKTVLSIDENCIRDYCNKVVYRWSDIETTRQKHGYLYLTLYHPEDYLDKIGSLHYRLVKKMWYKPGGKHNEFWVNVSLADISKDELSNLLHDYSAK
jgi:hypothetical protein